MKILSIDLDFFMEPCIQLYNDMIRPDIPVPNLWNDIMKLRDLDRHLSYDEKRFDYIKNIINYNKIQQSTFIWGDDHSSIILALDMLNCLKDNDQIELINIDHHHDILYSENGQRNIDLYDVINCGNWVYYLFHHNMLQSYTWIKNKNSMDFPQNIADNLKFINIYTVQEWNNIDFKTNINADIVFISASPNYIPFKYKNKIDDIFNLMNNYPLFINMEGSVPCPNNQLPKFKNLISYKNYNKEK